MLEADLGLDRERQQPLAALGGGAARGSDIAHQPGAVLDQRVGREAILRRGAPDELRLDDHRVGGRADHAFDAPAPPALVHELDEPTALQLAHVVVDALARLAQPRGYLGGRPGLAELLQNGLAYRSERRADDLHDE